MSIKAIVEAIAWIRAERGSQYTKEAEQELMDLRFAADVVNVQGIFEEEDASEETMDEIDRAEAILEAIASEIIPSEVPHVD